AEKRSSGERARETGGAEGTGDAVLGRTVVEEALLSQEHVLELENSKGPSLASLEGEEDKGKSSSSQVVGPVQEEEYVAEKLPSRFIESAHTELAKDDAAPAPPVTNTKAQDRGVEGELGNEESLDRNEEDLGAEDGWTMDAEADHSGGSDRNSMDSVDSCCSLKKTESFQNAQAGSNPKKVDLIIWEIEVPKHLVGRLIGKQGR
ncbi:AKAP1 isoform 13, partial [Pongo abelii]